MTRFRPCIDLHAGQVKQIVGGTLSIRESDLKTNYISQYPSAYFAKLYRDANLLGAHVIMLGPGNDVAAKEALAAWPGHLQVGGGITDSNAKEWIDAGAERVSLQRLYHPKFGSRSSLSKSLHAVGHYHFVSFPQWSLLSRAVTVSACVDRK